MAAIPIAIWKGDLKTAACLNQELLDQALRSNLPFWRAFATVYGNIIDGQPVLPGTEHAILLEQTPLLMDIVGAVQPVLPSALLLERVRDGKVGWSAPEVLRVAALGAVDPADDASLARCVASLHRALAISTEQGALFWSLRVLVSLCEILPVGDPAQALVKDRLSALLEQVDDGSQMPDLARARELAHGVARR